MKDHPRYFPIMVRKSFKTGYLSGDDLFRELRRIGVFSLVLQVPYKFMLEHETQAQKNHSQTIGRLAERGGLEASEACAVLQDRPWQTMDYTGANVVLQDLCRRWVRERNAKITESAEKDIGK